ncbi:MAG: TlpA family protein disulfide reductase [Myxococcales bacterium]|nr:TlpA family protein disulfide reductase [Myxococcales bacterium]
MQTRTLIVMFVAATVGLVVLGFVTLSSDPQKPALSLGASPAAAACTKGQTDCLPELTYVDITGATYTPESLKGKVVVVNFWATWCRPCQVEIPAFSRTYDKYKDQDVVFLGILSDDVDSQTLLNFTSEFELTYPVVRVTQEMQAAYGYPNGLPTTFIYGRNGQRRFQRAGALAESTLTNQLDKLIAER